MVFCFPQYRKVKALRSLIKLFFVLYMRTIYFLYISFMTKKNETTCGAFHVVVKGTERFVKAVIWSCESALMSIKRRLLTKKHVNLVFLPSFFLPLFPFFLLSCFEVHSEDSRPCSSELLDTRLSPA